LKLFFLLFILSLSVFAADKTQKLKPENVKDPITTEHEVLIDGKKIKYKAKVGFINLNKNGKKDKAKLFYIAYTVDSDKHRPLTFSFNGGPGSSSVWMHMALLGPKRVLMDDEGMALKPPAKVVDNDLSILNKTDLVFIDPIGTGFSKPIGDGKQQEFSGVNEDISSIGEFIEKYISSNNRWKSPKYLIGESYGTFRAAGLSNHLFDKYGMRLNGVMLISSVLNYQTISQGAENIQAYVHFLPSLAATSWYHDKLLPRYKQKNLTDFLKEVEQFAQSEYLLSLYKGDRLSADEVNKVASKIAAYTGLSEEFVKQQNLKVSNFIYFKELLRKEEKVVGRFDGRYKDDAMSKGSQHAGYDPSYTHIYGPISEALNGYLREDLKYNEKSPYGILSNVHPWNFPKNRYAATTSYLKSAIVKNPYMKVFIASGYYDLATPYFATEFTFAQMNLPEKLQKNIAIAYYEAGHMMYLHMPSFKKLAADLDKFLDSSK